ncbi:SulP family inorganic anion transporter [Variovorax sp. GB1P17]|uniref:SulP family inorganic anion transporter n=1 Tax=Variovorax sp. GB1P17 TaxID=3443740 RepID=UPI003F47B265
MNTTSRRPGIADLVAGVSIAGLLLPEAVAYSGIAGLPPQAGVIALFAGLLVYGIFGSSRFAIVSATSSSAAVLFAATTSIPGVDTATRLALGAGIVLLAGVFFVIAGIAKLGAVSSLIAKPVLRGFALGLALTIVIKQLPKVLAVQPAHSDFFRLIAGLVSEWRHWNLAGAAMALAALVLLRVLARWRAVPAALLVIVCGIALDVSGLCHAWGVAAVGPISLDFSHPGVPSLDRAQWLGLGELAFAMALILYAESYGSIRTFAMRHGDNVSANRDLLALGGANLLSALFQGMPVGAGYSATSANESAGAQSRAAGIVAGLVVLVAVLTLLPWIAHTPEPLLAAIVINAVSHSLNPSSLRPYFHWRRDRLVALVAVAAVLLLGVLDGLLAAIGVSLLMLLRGFSRTTVSWLGRLGQSHDYVDTSRHPEAVVPPGVLIARPEVPLFFGNADAVFASIRARIDATPGLQRMVLSLEESPDLDATSIEAMCDFAAYVRVRGARLSLARVKDNVRDLLAKVDSPDLKAEVYAPWSVDDAMQAPQNAGSSVSAAPPAA